MSAGKKKGRQSWTSEDWAAEFKAASQTLAQDLGLDQPKQKRKKDSVWVYNKPDPETGLIKKRSKERKGKAPKKKGKSKAQLQVPQMETLHGHVVEDAPYYHQGDEVFLESCGQSDKIKEEKMDSAMDNGLCFKPSMAVKTCKQEVVIKIEKDDYVDGDSQCPTLQSGQEGSLLIDKEEKVVFQRSDGFKIYFIKQEPKEEVCHQETGPCSRGDMTSEQSSLQQRTLEAQPKEKTFVGDTKQDSVKEAEGVQAASGVSSGGCRNVIKESRHVLLDTNQDSVEEEGVGLPATSQVSSGGCRNVFEESRQRNSEHGRSKHAKLPSNVGMGHIKAEEITESEDGSEANVALSSKADEAIVKVEAPVPRTYACPMCSQRFSKRYHLKEHKYRIHSGERPYECPQCQEGFVRLRDLEYHFKIRHRSIYKTTCECGDILTDKQLDGHKRSCKGKKVNQCAQCENQIPGGIDLTQLKTVHNAERPYCSGYVKILPLNAALSIKCETKQPNVNPHDCLNSTRQGLSNLENGIKNSLEQGLSLSVPVGGIDREELNENRQESVNDRRLGNSEDGASCTENAKLINDVPESNLTARECEVEEGKESSIILPSGSNTIRLGKGVFKPFACSECNQGFYHQSWLVDHLRMHHAGIYNRLGL